MAGANAEPSMEDILSSIKRIIAEDSEAALSMPRVKRSVGLTPMVPPPVAMPDDDEDDEPDVLELTEEVAEAEAPAPEPAPEHEVESEPVAIAKRVEPAPAVEIPAEKPVLVSPETVEASRSSLAALSALIVKPEVPGGDTLEGMVRDMLKPMLTEWLDAKLPDVVERMVAQEIARITARS